MATTDNWIRFYRWCQEHLKSHFISSSIFNNNRHRLVHRRSSLTPFRSTNNSPLKKIKKRASYGEIDVHRIDNNNFRHVRDSIRGNIPHATRITSTTTHKERYQVQKSTTCNKSSEEILSHEFKFIPSNLITMNKKRNNRSRRFSLAKVEILTVNSNRTKDEQKSTAPSTSLNIIQKLLFRQINPKTRPYSRGTSSDGNVATTKVLNETPTNLRAPSPAFSKQPGTSSSSSNISKQNIRHGREPLLSLPPNKIPLKNHSSDLNPYLSKRRNTTGSISLNKIVDTKNTLNGNTLLATAVNAFNNSNNKIQIEKDIFQTVEDSDFLLTKQFIQTNENIINSYNEYDWRPLDIAIMLNNILMVQFLLHYGAEESPKLQSTDSRYQSVCHQLSMLSEQHSDDSIKKSPSNKLSPDDIQSRRLSPLCDKQQRHRRTSKNQQQQQFNQQRLLTLTQMKDNYEQAVVPDAPTNVRLMVTGSDNITVTFDEPLRSNGAVVIKYKIEWSTDEYFNQISFDIIKNCFSREYIIRNLSVGQKCYVRVLAGNMKGFGEANIANPPYCIPSNWREFSKISRTNMYDLRFEEILNKIFNEREGIRISKSLEGNESSDTSNRRNPRRNYGNLRKNLRQLFQFYPRLAKTIKRGLYLVSVMLNGDRILVTNEDVLPMVEVDENYGHNLLPDFQWFMKLTFVWDDLKSLRPKLERCSSATSFYLRMKLVQAAIELQTLEEINNLGRLHYTYIRDNDGNVVFVLINDLSSDIRTNISPSNLKWMTMTKFFEIMKESPSSTNNSCLQQIIEKLPDMIEFYHASMCRLESGLYVAYLKMQNSVDSIRVMVNKSMPGSLPCTKIRSVANVSREEWAWLHKSNDENSIEYESSDNNNSLDLFKIQFRNAAKDLFIMLNLPETHFSNSRIYSSQVVEIRDDLSLIILMSTADEINFLSAPSNYSLTSFIYLPIYIFEVLQHISNNYRFICQYSRVSICLDFELIYAQQNQREAFSINELDETRYRLNHLLSCQQDLDDIWRLSRWLVHVINCAKDKTYSGISLKPFQSSTNLNEIKIKQSSSTSSLICSFDSNNHLRMKNLNNFIDFEDNTIELTFYNSLLSSNTYIPFKLRINKMTRLNEILKIMLKQQQHDIFLKSNSSLKFIWIRSNQCEYIMEENSTAYEIQTRLLRFGGQIHLRLNNSSSTNSSPIFSKTSNLFPPTIDMISKGPGSSLSLNIILINVM
ncbi:unnamed protein product [Rotaria sordida]|uniref:Fibronectin type-III domain-containing protein n=1 Tax=Rotaria sordida TaxID=392033 RepID=A0A813QCD8_9BILA|nr:unnamed protein product [Rotaria sordida]CAF0768998.1 unnamed protein product [Rotaria sordida]